jgi:hypothetical protein
MLVGVGLGGCVSLRSPAIVRHAMVAHVSRRDRLHPRERARARERTSDERCGKCGPVGSQRWIQYGCTRVSARCRSCHMSAVELRGPTCPRASPASALRGNPRPPTSGATSAPRTCSGVCTAFSRASVTGRKEKPQEIRPHLSVFAVAYVTRPSRGCFLTTTVSVLSFTVLQLTNSQRTGCKAVLYRYCEETESESKSLTRPVPTPFTLTNSH